MLLTFRFANMNDDENYSLKIEAAEVIKEIGFAVKSVELSKIIKSSDELVYFNLETNERLKYCVELSPRGFRVSIEGFSQNIFEN